jgi:hypothetical protein
MNFRHAILPLLGALLLAQATPARAGDGELMEYDITWIGVSVGTMSVSSAVGDEGGITRSIRVRNRPWIALVYPVDNTVECRIESTPDGPRHTVTKQMGEKEFVQDDTLTLWPDAGKAVWTNAVSNTVHAFEVPPGARDFVSFFFDLRDAAADGNWSADRDYQLVMDDALHALEIRVGEPRRLRTPWGRMNAIPVEAVSKSPVLFKRNKPRAVWVAAHRPVVLFADVETRFGTVRGTLARWELDGHPVEWKASKPETD